MHQDSSQNDKNEFNVVGTVSLSIIVISIVTFFISVFVNTRLSVWALGKHVMKSEYFQSFSEIRFNLSWVKLWRDCCRQRAFSWTTLETMSYRERSRSRRWELRLGFGNSWRFERYWWDGVFIMMERVKIFTKIKLVNESHVLNQGRISRVMFFWNSRFWAVVSVCLCDSIS